MHSLGCKGWFLDLDSLKRGSAIVLLLVLVNAGSVESTSDIVEKEGLPSRGGEEGSSEGTEGL